jgi:TetR/AcrR family transcriptional regulator, cholesterol catabolism regulator
VVQKSNSRSIEQRSPRRRRRRDARRDEILRAAGRMFRERGFAETGMRDIASAAELSAANLYHYFRGKDEILFYCQDRALDRMLAAVAARPTPGARAAARLHAVLTEHLRTLLDEVEGATAHLQIESLPPALRDRIVRKRDRYEHALRRLIADGVRAGDFVAADPALVTRAMLGALNWTVTWFRPDGPQDAETVSRSVVEFLLRGIAARSVARSARILRLSAARRRTASAGVN